MRARALAISLSVALAMAHAAGDAAAQNISLGSKTDKPVEIYASEGIEWRRDSQTYIARGDARAVQGDTTVSADTLTAHYRTKPDGNTEIARIEADGAVRITTPTQQARGDRGVYDVEKGVLVLTGRDITFTTPRETLTARDSLEYWEQRRIAVARGNAVATSEGRKLRADLITAYFVNDGDSAKLDRVDVQGNVQVATATEFVRADQGVYAPKSGVATLTGGVKITRGPNQLNGDYAEVNLNTGVSRLMSRNQRVRGLLVPPQSSGAPPPPAPRR